MDLTFGTADGVFNVRAAVVLLHEGRMLLQGDRRCHFFVPPGGRCMLHEHTKQAARREVAEELGCSIDVGRLLWFVENFFNHDGRRFHQLTFVYEGTLPDDAPFLGAVGDFAGIESDPEMFFRWVDLDDLTDLEVYPDVLREWRGVPAQRTCPSSPSAFEH